MDKRKPRIYFKTEIYFLDDFLKSRITAHAQRCVLPVGFTTMAVIDPPESKLAKRTSVHCATPNQRRR